MTRTAVVGVPGFTEKERGLQHRAEVLVETLVGKPVAWIALAALLVRFMWWQKMGVVVSDDGAEYLCVARNLVTGNGLAGCDGFPELMYAPLYSILIAAVSLATRDIETAARLVSVVAGAALVVGVFLTASLVYGHRVAYIAALLATLHPVLVQLGASTYNEAVYIPLFVAGIYCGLRAVLGAGVRFAVMAGAWFGLAGLSRPEAFAYPLFFGGAVLVLAIATRGPLQPAIRRALPMLMAFAIVTAPYVVFLHAETGQVRLEGKWNINFTIDNRRLSGMDYPLAGFGVGFDADSSGPLLQPGRFAAYTPFPQGMLDKVGTLIGMGLANRRDLFAALESNLIVGPLVFALTLLALLRPPWHRSRALFESVLLLMAISVLILVGTAHTVSDRYLFPLLPIVVIWIAKGIVESGQTVLRLAKIAPWPQRLTAVAPIAVSSCVQIGVAGAVLLSSADASRFVYVFAQERPRQLPTKEAGAWLSRYAKPQDHVMTWSTPAAWYGNTKFQQFPVADVNTTLRYIAEHNPDFIYLDGYYAHPAPTMDDWLANGIPDSRAELVYQFAGEGGPILIYRWTGGQSRSDPSLSLTAGVP